jgi:DHA2 family multidrug resistance protein
MAGGAQSGEWTAERSAAGNRSPWLILSIISIATFMEVLDISIANVSLDHIAGSLSATYDESTWILTSYLIANAVAVPISGWLSNVVGRKRFYVICVALFTVSSLLCGMAHDLGFLIVARIFQGLGGGGLAPSEQSMLTDSFAPAKRGGALAIYGMTVICAPIFGPTLGGWITDQFSWHWVFLINVPIGLLSLFLVNVFVVDPPKVEEERRARLQGGLKVDGLGIVLIVLWLGCLEYALDRGQRLDWLQDPSIVATLSIAATSCLFLFAWEWGEKDPVFDVRLLFKRTYLLSILGMMMIAGVFLGTTQLIPQFTQQALGYTATSAGLAMTFGGVATLVLMPVAGRLISFVQAKYMMVAGLASEAIALFGFTHLNSDVSWGWVALTRTGVAIGIPFMFIGINTAAYAEIPGDKTAQASAQLNLARNLGGSLVISLAQAVLEQRQQFHQSRLVETLAPGDPSYRNWTSAVTSAFHGQGARAPLAGLGQIYNGVTQQAQIKAYSDVFWALAVAAAVLTPFFLFMNKIKPGAPKPEAH